MFNTFRNHFIVTAVLVAGIVMEAMGAILSRLDDAEFPFFLLGDVIGGIPALVAIFWVVAHAFTYMWKGDTPTGRDILIRILNVTLLLILMFVGFLM